MTKDDSFFHKKMDRREFLKKAGIGGAGLAIGLSGASAFFGKQASDEKAIADGDEAISFYGKHQAGVTTAMQKNIYFVVLDLIDTDKDTVIQMFKDWTAYSQKLVDGELVKKDNSNAYLPPSDTGETVGLNPYRLTLTFGVSADFLKKMGLEKKRPKLFRDMPPFPREQLQEKYTGGDLIIQACADDEQVAFHAVRNLVRKAKYAVTMRWSQSGFAAIGDRLETPRNLFGFKDGTANVKTEKDYDDVIWVKSSDWLNGGTYMAVRRVQMLLDTWDRTNLKEQENTFGRYKDSGAPFGKTNEFDEVDLSLKDDNGDPLIPVDAHVRLAKEAGVPIYRRSYSYSDGIIESTGQFDTGLLFISFQKDPENFIKIQTNLGNLDKMNEYTKHVGSGLFACFGGIKKGEYIGQALFD
ncbi:iron uptake transporter deferrochelatase/peroxidase subunit [Streptococcus sp. DD12]|uniref:iron uptake transporter deferrochelatase/peroxidase subunit n=1 Tax=Streptococcus sp. DD12 TaxID=1777880 RepID=UPI00079B5789|nr:iron uptake transporter deferrochelatase/peroxidase subunit [Streptococcus sp. DD12]KXT76038.1 Ferrous iron transport peroxidase EfeB [Streptococcus sp. DD12]